MSFGISLESKKFNLDHIKTLIKILFSSNFGMQISAKNWDYLIFFLKNSKEYKFLGFHLNRNYFYLDLIKNIDKDTIFIKFWNANIGKNLGLFKKIIKNLNPFVNSKTI